MVEWVWSLQTREELREALETEIRSFTVDKVRWRSADCHVTVM